MRRFGDGRAGFGVAFADILLLHIFVLFCSLVFVVVFVVFFFCRDTCLVVVRTRSFE